MSDLLLDTCALLWLAQGGGELSAEALAVIDAAKFVHVSAISAWELGLLTERKQVQLPQPVAEWFAHFCDAQNIQVLNIDSDVAFAANALPWYHRDPADRFILATAQLHKLTIVTKDQQFKAYPIPVIS